MKKALEYILSGLIALAVIVPVAALAATQYGAGTLLQVGDVLSSHILNGTVLDVDISNSAAISGMKVAGGGAGGLIVFSNNTQLATSTNLKFATSTNDFYVLTGRIHATSTNFNGVNQTWPSADGAANESLTTNGAGVLSWAAAGGSSLSTTFTAGETIDTGDAVAVASSTTNRILFPRIGADLTNDFGRTVNSYHGASVSTTTTICTNFIRASLSTVGTPTDSAYVDINGNNAGNPDDISVASTTIAAASLTGTPTNYILNLSSRFCFTGGTQYWIVFRRTGALNDTNYYQWDRNTVTQNRGPNDRIYTAGAWGSDATSWSHYDMGLALQAGNVYRTNTEYNGFYEGFVGFAQATTTASSTVTVTTAGAATAVQGVRAGLQYYLSNVFGDVLTTVGANSRKAAVGAGSGTAVITNIW